MSAEVNAKNIFLKAIELSDENQRIAYVEDACVGNCDLRNHVNQLIEAHFEVDSLLDNPRLAVKRMLDKENSPDTLPSQSIHAGVQIGPYKLLEQIGVGGMGIVYMAEQLKPIRRKVAVKIIKPGMDTAQVIARFEAERQALAMMDHPNIAHVLDAGSTEFHRPFFVMELVRGIPITDYCDKNKLTTNERLTLFATVCQAVQHAHTKGIIHRDLKPSNILVTMHDGVPVPKIIDFGVAKATSQQLTDRTLFTSIHQFVGTPLYMSPEQAELSGLDVDTRSDIYSLGVLLYELLTGTTPFDRRRLNEAALDEVRRIIREEEPQKPSTRVSSMGDASSSISVSRSTDPNKLSQSLRYELDWIVMKTLEKDRTRRYETANALANEIQRFLNGEPVEACPPSAAYRFRKFVNRNRAPVGFATAIGLLVLGSTLLAWWLYADARRSRDSAVAAQVELVAERDRALTAEKSAAANLETATREKSRADEKSVELRQRLYNYNIIKAESAFRENQFDKAQGFLADCDESQRHWEWKYLNRLTGGRRAIQIPNEIVLEFLITRDGLRAVVMDSKGTASLIRLQDGTAIWSIKSKIFTCWGIAFSPDERNIVIVGSNQLDQGSNETPMIGTVQLLNMTDGKSLWEHSLSDGCHTFPKFSPNGKLILTTVGFPGAKKSEVQVRLATDGSLQQSCPALAAAIAIFDSTGERIFVSETKDSGPQASSTIRCLNSNDLSSLWSINRPNEASAIALSPDGSELVSGGPNHSLVIWDAKTGDLRQRVEGPIAEFVFMQRFSHDGHRLLTIGMFGQCVVWDWATKKPIQSFGKVSRDLFVVNLTPDGSQLMYVDSTPNTLLGRSVLPPAETVRLLGHRQGFKGGKFIDRGTLVSAGPEGTIRIWNAWTTQELKTIPAGAVCLEVAGSPDGKWIATATTNGVMLWDRTSGKAVHRWADMGETWFIRFADDGRILAACGEKGVVRLWSTEDGRVLHSLQHDGSVHGFDISEDGTQVVALSLPGCVITRWNITDSSKTIVRNAEGTGRGRTVKLAPNGKWAAAGVGSTVEIWNLETMQLESKLTGFGGEAMSIAIDSKGERLFVGTSDGMLHDWNVETKEIVLSIRAHDTNVVCLSVSPDDTTLLSSSLGGELKLWESMDIGYPMLEQRANVQKATEIVNRLMADKHSAGSVMTQIANDASIDNSEVRSTAIAIANARSSSPIVRDAYSASETKAKIKQTRSLKELLADASQVIEDQIESSLGDRLNALQAADDKKFDPGTWHGTAQQMVEIRISDIPLESIVVLLDRSVFASKPTHYMSYLKGVMHTKLGQWEQAEKSFTQALGLVPEKTKYWHEYAYRLAFLRAYLGQWESYHELCTKTLEDFADTEDERLAERTSKMCLFSDRIGVDAHKAGELADRAWEHRENSKILHYTEMALGIADLRRGIHEKAIVHLESSIKGLSQFGPGPGHSATLATKLYAAIAFKHLGRDEDARRFLKEATSGLNSTPDSFTSWNDWMNAQLVKTEAISVVQP